VASIAVCCSCLFRYVPFLQGISDGISIIICTITAATLGAIFFPVDEKEDA